MSEHSEINQGTGTEALERISKAADAVRRKLELIYDYNLQQAKQSFLYTSLAAGIGFGVLIIAVLLMLKELIPAGLVTIAASAIGEGFAVFFARRLTEANKQVLDGQGKLSELEGIYLSIELVRTTDISIRDRYTGIIILKLTGLVPHGQEIPLVDILAKEQVSSHQVRPNTPKRSTSE
jgi:hypothetical protein